MDGFQFLVVAIVCSTSSHAKELTHIEALSSQPTSCVYEYAYDMYGAYCAGLGLSKIPSLRNGVEILNLSDNKLIELTSDTFSSCTGVKFLYLEDNKIYSITPNALDSLTYLQTLDLSRNVLTYISNSILQLPSLRKLYLSGNPLMLISSSPFTTPIRAPLEYLDLSDSKIMKLPELGTLPLLKFYNVSHNPLTYISADHFAAICNLKSVVLTESVKDIKPCDLQPVIWWLKLQGVDIQLDYSALNTKELESCSVGDIGFSLNITRHRCKTSQYIQVEHTVTKRRTWLTIVGGLGGFFVGFILLLYVMHRCNVALNKRTKNIQKPAPDGDRNASAILLNNVS